MANRRIRREDLTQEEKIRLVTGMGMWRTWDGQGKIPSLLMTDGPHGVRKEIEGTQYDEAEPATCFPTASCLASSWDADLVGDLARALAEESIQKGVDILLGPGVTMKRTPLCGRNFEYFSEDPYLTGILATAYVKELQAMGVGASLKHFAVNNQESNRQTANAQVDERALREIYLRAFEMVVKAAQPATIMSSYNRLNGRYVGESAWLLTDILRKEWGFRGLVVSDWSAIIHLDEAIRAGLDLEMPDSLGIHREDLEEGLMSGRVREEDLDRAVDRILDLIKASLENLDRWAGGPGKGAKSQGAGDAADLADRHHDLARRMAGQSAVLLKNEGVLPLDPALSPEVTVIGAMARSPRFQGGGSSQVNARLRQDMVEALEEAGFRVDYAPGYRMDSLEEDRALVDEALGRIHPDRPVLFFGGLTDLVEGEGFDRADLMLPANQISLMDRVREKADRVIYLSFSGAPYEVPFADRMDAILQVYLAGQACSEAVADLVTGRVNPSGRLAETWPLRLEDVASSRYFDRTSKDLEYRESLFVGYRYFSSYEVPTLFPFGHGLSYTDFAYRDFRVLDQGRTVRVRVENTGQRAGREVVQVYVENPDRGRIQARRELRGFCKVHLDPGQSREVEIPLDDRAYAVYEPGRGFVQVAGTYRVQLGRSVEDILMEKEVQVDGISLPGHDRESYPDFFQEGPLEVSQDTFRRLYGRPLSHFDRQGKGDYSLASTLNDMAKTSRMARLTRALVTRAIYRMFPNRRPEDPQVQMMIHGATTGPIDAVACQSGSRAIYRLVCLTVNLANGRFSFAKPRRQ